jgi:hypothetical protein
MAILKALGKNELKELGCNFVVANVPVFAAVSDPKKVNHMVTTRFGTLEEVKDFIQKNTPFVVFDTTGVYKEKADLEALDPGFMVRGCRLDPKEFESLRSNLRESENLIFSFNFDFSCWFNNSI